MITAVAEEAKLVIMMGIDVVFTQNVNFKNACGKNRLILIVLREKWLILVTLQLPTHC